MAFLDWDGTIVDTAQAGEDAFMDFYTELFKVSREDVLPLWRSFDGKPISGQYELVRKTAMERNIPFTMTEKEYTDSFIAAKLGKIEKGGGVVSTAVPGAVEFIRYLKSLGVEVYVASGFRLKELREQISALGLDDAFDGVYGSPTNDSEAAGLPESKAKYIESILKTRGIDPKRAIMVGDAVHDIHSGLEAGAIAIGRARDPERAAMLSSAKAAFVVTDFRDPTGIVRQIENIMAPSSPGQPNLSGVIEEYANNRRAGFIQKANKLIGMNKENSEFKKAVGSENMKHEDPTADITDRVKRIIKFIDSIDKGKGSAENVSISDFLKTNMDQLEADALIAAIIIHARQAKKDGKTFILGLETDWIPGIKDVGYGTQHDAINLIMQKIDELDEALKSIGLDNVEIIHKPNGELADVLLDRKNQTQTNFSNIVILASDKTVKLPNFKPFMDADYEDRPFIALIDPKYLEEWYRSNKSSFQQLDINIIEMLHIAMELATGKNRPGAPIVYDYDDKRRIVILLPRVEPKDYQKELLEIYKGRERALQAA